ncbi:MAG: CBS domain-containing protein [Phycisphaerales bacterium]
MNFIRELLAQKGDGVRSVPGDCTVLDAACAMNEAHIGAVVVLEGGRMAGILTERDVMTRVVAAGRDPARTRVSQVMTSRVLTCTPQTRLSEARAVMRSKRIRHLPVVEGDVVVGIVSIGDMNLCETETLVETIRHMEAYIAGEVAL